MEDVSTDEEDYSENRRRKNRKKLTKKGQKEQVTEEIQRFAFRLVLIVWRFVQLVSAEQCG